MRSGLIYLLFYLWPLLLVCIYSLFSSCFTETEGYRTESLSVLGKSALLLYCCSHTNITHYIISFTTRRQRKKEHKGVTIWYHIAKIYQEYHVFLLPGTFIRSLRDITHHPSPANLHYKPMRAHVHTHTHRLYVEVQLVTISMEWDLMKLWHKSSYSAVLQTDTPTWSRQWNYIIYSGFTMNTT